MFPSTASDDRAPITPGQHIARCREAAGLSLEDVAIAIATDPAIGAIARIEWLRLVEADLSSASPDVVAALGPHFPIGDVAADGDR